MSKLDNPIAMYVHDDKKYFITCSDDNRIKCFKYENGKVSNDYNQDEYILFLKVLNSIRVNKKKSINLGIREENGKLFETFFDLKNNLYYWNEVVDGSRYEPSKSDWQYLNVKYNDVPDVLAEIDGNMNPQDKELDEKLQAFKRRIVHAGEILAVLVTAGVSLISISDAVLDTSIGDKIRSVLSTEQIMEAANSVSDYERNQPYDFQMISDAVSSNKKISDEEKAFILKFKDYFNDFHEHMDVETVVKRFETLRIKYHEEPNENPAVAATYTPLKNMIDVYNTTSFEKSNLQFLGHEVLHVTQVNNSNSLTLELTNQAALEEYLRNAVEDGLISDTNFKTDAGVPYYSGGYQNAMWSYYLVANLMDEEARKDFQCSCDNEIIIKELMELNPSWNAEELEDVRVKGMELIETIDRFREHDEETGFDNVKMTYEKKKKFIEQLDYFYTIAYGKTIDECITESIMQYNNNYESLDEKDPLVRSLSNVMYQKADENYDNINYQGNELLGNSRYVLPKSYFSDRHENPILYMNIMLKNSNSGYEGVFVNTEITPEVEYSIQSQAQELINEQKEKEDERSKMYVLDSINLEEVDKVLSLEQKNIQIEEYKSFFDENGKLTNENIIHTFGYTYNILIEGVNSTYIDVDILAFEYQGEVLRLEEAYARGWIDLYKVVKEKHEYEVNDELANEIRQKFDSGITDFTIYYKDGGTGLLKQEDNGVLYVKRFDKDGNQVSRIDEENKKAAQEQNDDSER